MKRHGITITFDYEANDAQTEEAIVDLFYEKMENWTNCFRMDVEVGKPEFEAI